MPFDKSTRELYRKATEGSSKLSQMIYMQEYQQKKLEDMRKADTIYEWYTFVMQYRNLTQREARIYYKACIKVDAINPRQDAASVSNTEEETRNSTILGNSVKRYTRLFTWQLDLGSIYARCPCCQYPQLARISHWYRVPGFIDTNIIRICRYCKYQLMRRAIDWHCISVYYPQWCKCWGDHGVSVANEVFSQFIKLGIVYDVNDSVMVAHQKEYMLSRIDRKGFVWSKKYDSNVVDGMI